MDLGKLILRLVAGGLLGAHGLQKLRGSFGGPGLTGTEGFMGALGMHPARRNAVAVAWTETAGGAAIALGAGTPFAAAGLIATQLVAVQKVHGKNGPWASGGGYEYNAVLIALLTALADDGPGRVSLDALLGKSRWGLGWGVFALVAGAAGAAGVLQAAQRSAPPADAAPNGAATDAPVSTDDPAEGATAETADASI